MKKSKNLSDENESISQEIFEIGLKKICDNPTLLQKMNFEITMFSKRFIIKIEDKKDILIHNIEYYPNFNYHFSQKIGEDVVFQYSDGECQLVFSDDDFSKVKDFCRRYKISLSFEMILKHKQELDANFEKIKNDMEDMSILLKKIEKH